MSKGSGAHEGLGPQPSTGASDVLYLCLTAGFSLSSFSTVGKAQTAITDFIIQLVNLDNVPRQLYDELSDLLVNLKTRNLRWSSLRFQLMTLPKNTSNGEVIALQSQLSMCPELRPTNKQTHFGPNNWRSRNSHSKTWRVLQPHELNARSFNARSYYEIKPGLTMSKVYVSVLELYQYMSNASPLVCNV